MIPIKSKQVLNIMRDGGRILAQIMNELKEKVAPGITTNDLNRAAEALIFRFGAEPAFKGHEGFPATLCTSLNSVVVHQVPSDYKLKVGDVLSLDLGIKYKGFCADMAITLIVASKVSRSDLDKNGLGQPSSAVDFEAVRMVRAAGKALKLGIKKAKVGNTFGDVGNTIQRHIEGQGFGVVRELCGHGIGREVHEEPQIPNYAKRKSGKEIKEGMVFCLEPMLTMDKPKLIKSTDGFGWETKDGSLSAHFEHTIAIVNGKPQVLTKI